jgi:DNA-binding GntR family transcriptional regulator
MPSRRVEHLNRQLDSLELPVVSTVEALAQALRGQILDGTIKPGERLREVEYSDRFNVARHSFRAATQALVHEGLLKRAPNRGVHVPVLGVEDIRDIYRARAAIEVEAMRICVLESRSTAAAAAAVDEMQAIPDTARWRDLVDLDLRFHKCFVDATASPRLMRMYATAQSEITLCLGQLRRHYARPAQQIAAEHSELLAPVLAGDVVEAERRLRTHLLDAVENLTGLIEELDSVDR